MRQDSPGSKLTRGDAIALAGTIHAIALKIESLAYLVANQDSRHTDPAALTDAFRGVGVFLSESAAALFSASSEMERSAKPGRYSVLGRKSESCSSFTEE